MGEREGEGGGGRSRYLLDDGRVEAVKSAVQPDALKEKESDCVIDHTHL